MTIEKLFQIIMVALSLIFAGEIGVLLLDAAMQMHETRQRCEGPQAWAFIECRGIATLPPLRASSPAVKP